MRRTRPAASGSEAGGRHRPVLEFLDARTPIGVASSPALRGPAPQRWPALQSAVCSVPDGERSCVTDSGSGSSGPLLRDGCRSCRPARLPRRAEQGHRMISLPCRTSRRAPSVPRC